MIVQINCYICDRCKQQTATVSETVYLYRDPVVGLPEGWRELDDKECTLLCPKCDAEHTKAVMKINPY